MKTSEETNMEEKERERERESTLRTRLLALLLGTRTLLGTKGIATRNKNATVLGAERQTQRQRGRQRDRKETRGRHKYDKEK